jgi:hypothetical protein
LLYQGASAVPARILPLAENPSKLVRLACTNRELTVTESRIQTRIAQLRERSLKRTEITSAGMVQHAMDVFLEAKAARQYSAAISALREAAILAGVRVERSEQGDPGAFANLSEKEIDAMLVAEFARIAAIPANDASSNGG